MVRRSITALWLCALAAGMLFAGCGDDDGGGGGGGGGEGGLATGTFVKTIENGGRAWGAPFVAMTEDREQHLVLAGDIDGSGYLQSLSLRRDADVVSAVSCTSVMIKMGHTSLGSLGTTFAANVEQGKGSLITVRNAAVFTVPTGSAGTYFAIPLDTLFHYNGVDNLVVEFVQSGGCSDIADLSAGLGTGVSLHAWSTGGATGTLYDEYLDMKFSFAGGVDTLEYGGANESGAAPFGWVHARFQTMYPADEINGSGPITGLGFKTSATTTTGAYTYTLMLGHTARSVLSTTFADNYRGSPVTVVSNGTFTIPGGIPANTYIWVPFPGSFTYNGTDNLLVDLEVTAGEETNSLVYTVGVGTARFAMGWAGSSTATLGYNGNVLDQAFRFKGSTMDVLTAANASDTYPFSGDVNPIQQCLYRQAMLGTKGSIDKIAFRLTMPSTAGTYGNFQVVMGHTSASAMTATFADNMVDAQTVYNGAFTVPAGKAAGDWIEIPLSSPFAYDGIRNLVVQVSADQGTATNEIAAEVDARYGLSQTEHFDRTSATALYVNTQMLDQRLWLK